MHLTSQVFANDSAALYHGDAWQTLQTLPDASVDAVITDPPYSSGAFSLSGKQASPAAKYQNSGTAKQYPEMLGDGKDQRSFFAWATLWLTECWRLAKPGAPLLVFTDWRQLPTVTDAVQAAGFNWRGVLVWHKKSGRPMLGEFRRDCEFVVYACKGKFQAPTRRCLPGVFHYPVRAAEKWHLTGKPLQLVMDLMDIVPEGGTVLDPFAGGGTVALAARETGRKSVNIELSAEYAEIIKNRLSTNE